jgi:hypothetical protein
LARSILRVTLAAAVISALVLVVARWRIEQMEAHAGPSPLATHWRYATEQEWIVSQVAEALVNMAHFARTREAPDLTGAVRVETATDSGETATFVVRVPGAHVTRRLQVTDYIWSPQMYAPLAAELLGPAGSPATTASPWETATLAALTRPRTDVMVAESERVSAALAARMTDPAAQEDAALLFAALGLREWSGRFQDNHRTLSRLAAHLAMAAAGRKGAAPGSSGQIAEATLLTLAFRDQHAVLKRLDALDAQPGLSTAAHAWSRALRLRNTQDWRILARPETASLLERREHFVAVYSKLGSTPGLTLLDRLEPDGLSDWGSFVLANDYPVEGGNRFVPAGLAEVLNETTQMPLGLVGPPEPAHLVKALNEDPAPGPVRRGAGGTTVEVLDSGTWAAFAQRHLLHHVESGVDFTIRMLGLDEQADAYRSRMQKSFGGLRQFPLAARRMAKDRAAYGVAMRRSLELLVAGPEHLGGSNWMSLFDAPGFPAEGFAVPGIETWYRPLFPAGTYFDWPQRLFRPGRVPRVRGAALQQMRQALPYSSDVVITAVWDRLGTPAPDVLESEYGPMVEYDLALLTLLAEASKQDPPRYERLYRRISALNPDHLATLARYLVDHGQTEEAVATYEAYVAKAPNRVGVCNNLSWLVRHYEETGHQRRALELAREAAEIYCLEGLLTLAELYERRKQWTEAEGYFRRAAERYDAEDIGLLAFYLRHQRATHDERYRGRRQVLLDKFFPIGLETATSDPAQAPDDGALLVGTSSETEKATLKRGDVIVAVNGFRVHTPDQYGVARRLGPGPELNLVVWRGTYLHITARPPNGWFGAPMKTYGAVDEPARKPVRPSSPAPRS